MSPLLNRINPAALISDALYCLNVYGRARAVYAGHGYSVRDVRASADWDISDRKEGTLWQYLRHI